MSPEFRPNALKVGKNGCGEVEICATSRRDSVDCEIDRVVNEVLRIHECSLSNVVG